MASDDRSEKAETGMVPQVANRGIMRPPLVYLGAIASVCCCISCGQSGLCLVS